MMRMKFHLNLKGKDKIETIENYSILVLFTGVSFLSLGIGFSIISTKGIPIILAMFGSVISFLATVALIFVWLVKEFEK